MPDKKLKLKEIIQLMEMDDPRTSIMQKFDSAKMALIQLSDEYDNNGNNSAKALVDELIVQLQNIYTNNKVFK